MLGARPGPTQPVTAALECAWPTLTPSREAGSYMGEKQTYPGSRPIIAGDPKQPSNRTHRADPRAAPTIADRRWTYSGGSTSSDIARPYWAARGSWESGGAISQQRVNSTPSRCFRP